MERVRRPRRAHRRVPESLRRGEKLDVPHRVQRAALPGSGAFYLTLVPIRRRSRGERRSLRTFPGVSLRPPLAFNPRHRRLSTPLLTPMNSTPTSLCMERPSVPPGADVHAGVLRDRRHAARHPRRAPVRAAVSVPRSVAHVAHGRGRRRGARESSAVRRIASFIHSDRFPRAPARASSVVS